MSRRLAVHTFSILLLLWPGALHAQTADEMNDLRKQILELEQSLASLKLKVDAMERTRPVPATPAAPPDSQTAPPSPVAASNPLGQRETSRRDAETVARVDNIPLDPSRKGYISIPGTASSFKIGGYAKMDAIVDPRLAGNPDQFLTSSIPVNVASGANTSSFNLHGRQTRFNVDFRRPSGTVPVRMFLEADFFGSGGATAFRMRHAYGQARNLLAGWTWSTLVDADAFPDTLDNMSPNGTSKTRQPQVRYTVSMPGGNSLALAVEKPNAEISIEGVSNVNRFPDAIVRYRHDSQRGHLQLGGVFRQIGGASQSLNAEWSVFGSGAMLTGGIKVLDGDFLVFGTTYGHGMAHYIDVVSGLGLDAAVNATRTDLTALQAFGSYGGYQHRWSRTLRSTATYGFAQVTNSPSQEDSVFNYGHYASGNIIWRPSRTGEVGVEYLFGEHVQKDGASAIASRVQFSLKYDLIY
jgi:DcaP outer membrane protein